MVTSFFSTYKTSIFLSAGLARFVISRLLYSTVHQNPKGGLAFLQGFFEGKFEGGGEHQFC